MPVKIRHNSFVLIAIAILLIFAVAIFALEVVEVVAVEGGDNQEYTGTIEVVHLDDFETHNSTFIFYLVLGDEKGDIKKYEMLYDKQFPVIISGTKVKIKGSISEGKFLIDKKAEPKNPFEIISVPGLESGSSKKLSIKWFYAISSLILLSIIFVISILLYLYRIHR